MTAGVDRRAAALAREASRGGAADALTARGADTGIGEALLHLQTLLHGTDRLMVQALKTDPDLPATTGPHQARSRYVDTLSKLRCPGLIWL
jgi:hypothetical protein